MTVNNNQLIINFPLDINQNIFKPLDSLSLLSCCQVSKTWKYFMDQDDIWESLLESVPRGDRPQNISPKKIVLYHTVGSEQELVNIIESFVTSTNFNEIKELSCYYPINTKDAKSLLKIKENLSELRLKVLENMLDKLPVDFDLTDIDKEEVTTQLKIKCENLSIEDLSRTIQIYETINNSELSQSKRVLVDLSISVLSEIYEENKNKYNKSEQKLKTVKREPIFRLIMTNRSVERSSNIVQLVFRNYFIPAQIGLIHCYDVDQNNLYGPNIICGFFSEPLGIPFSIESEQIAGKLTQEILCADHEQLITMLNNMDISEFQINNVLIEKAKKYVNDLPIENPIDLPSLQVLILNLRYLNLFQNEQDKFWLIKVILIPMFKNLKINLNDDRSPENVHEFISHASPHFLRAKKIINFEYERLQKDFNKHILVIENENHRCFSLSSCRTTFPKIILATASFFALTLSYYYATNKI